MELLVFLNTLGGIFWLYKREKPGYESLAFSVYLLFIQDIQIVSGLC